MKKLDSAESFNNEGVECRRFPIKKFGNDCLLNKRWFGKPMLSELFTREVRNLGRGLIGEKHPDSVGEHHYVIEEARVLRRVQRSQAMQGFLKGDDVIVAIPNRATAEFAALDQ